MNFIDVTASAADGTGKVARLEATNVTIPIPERMRDAVKTAAGRPVVAGFRPEHFDLAGGQNETATVTGVAEVVEYLGNEELLHVNVSGLDIVAIVGSEFRVRPGDNVTLHMALDKVYLFDPESGMALNAERQMAAA